AGSALSRRARDAGRCGRGEPEAGTVEVRREAAESGAGEIAVSRRGLEGAIESDATQRISFAESPGDRPGLRQRPGGKVYLLDDVGWQEEHTSELQSRGHIVCRLLLEK